MSSMTIIVWNLCRRPGPFYHVTCAASVFLRHTQHSKYCCVAEINTNVKQVTANVVAFSRPSLYILSAMYVKVVSFLYMQRFWFKEWSLCCSLPFWAWIRRWFAQKIKVNYSLVVGRRWISSYACTMYVPFRSGRKLTEGSVRFQAEQFLGQLSLFQQTVTTVHQSFWCCWTQTCFARTLLNIQLADATHESTNKTPLIKFIYCLSSKFQPQH